jgi:hypothetical protein
VQHRVRQAGRGLALELVGLLAGNDLGQHHTERIDVAGGW